MLIKKNIPTGKIIKKTAKIAVLVILIVMTTLFTLFSILRTPSFQELAGRIAADMISRKFNTTMHIDRLRISDMLLVRVSGLKIFDQQDQVMITLDDLRIKIDRISPRDHLIRLDRVALEKGSFDLHYYSIDSLLNLNYVLNQLMPSSEGKSGDSIPWTIYCNSLTLDDMSFSYIDDRKDHSSDIMDFDDLMFSSIFLNLKNIFVFGDSISASFQHFSCDEKSGFSLLGFYGDSRVSSSGIRVSDMKIVTNKSSIDMDLEFLYDDFRNLGQFLDSVFIRANIRSSMLTLSDIGYFAPVLFKMKDPVMFSGNIDGYVSDFSAKSFAFNLGDFTEFSGDISMKGLPDFQSTFVSLDIKKLTTTPHDLSNFDLPMENPNIVLPEKLMLMGFTSVKGNYEGIMENFSAQLLVTSDLGNLKVNTNMHGKDPEGVFVYAGDFIVSGLQIGKLTDQEALGTLDMEMEFKGRGMNLKDLNLLLNGWVENLVYKNYKYEKIILGGLINSKSYSGRVMVLDPSLNLSFDGLVDFNAEMPELDFTLELVEARFFDLNLADRSQDMNLSAKVRGDFTGIDPESFKGKIVIDSLEYTENGTDYHMEHFELIRSRNVEDHDNIIIRSDYVDADFVGKFGIRELIAEINYFITRRSMDSVVFVPDEIHAQEIDFDIRLKDLTPVTEIFLPGFHLSPGASVRGKFNSGVKKLEFDALADMVTVKGYQIRDVGLSGRTSGENFFLEGRSSQVILMEEADSTFLSLDNFAIDAYTSADSIFYSLQWDNFDPEWTNKSLIKGFLRFPADRMIETSITQAEANFNGDWWKIEKENLIVLDSGFLKIQNLNISKGDEVFTVDGALTGHPEDTLRLVFDHWSLANFNPLLSSNDVELDGIINGKINLTRHDTIVNISARIKIDDFSFNQVYFGDADVRTTWLESEKSLSVDLDIFSKGEADSRYRILGVQGHYFPFSTQQNFDLEISSQNLNISVLKPLVTSFSSHIAGFVTGTLTVQGTTSKPVILGTLKLQRAELLVNYLNVMYSLANEVIFEENFIRFNNISVYDPSTNTAMLNGGIRHEYFKDMSLDLTIAPVKFLGFNLSRYQNNVFYGRAYASGTVRLSGPFKNISINVDVRTEKGTHVFIPIQNSVDISQSDFIIFTNQADTLETDTVQEIKVVGLDLYIAMNITRDADIEIILPGNIGFIRGNGFGNLVLGVDPIGNLTMTGSYQIQTGLFVFTLEQLVSRRFDILEGSKITWTGDINDAEVNITARYRLRTSLTGLGIAMIDPDAASQKIIVYTDIRLTGSLFNPNMSFGISFPNMPEQTRHAAYAVLDTNDLGLMNQQAISLLVLGSFSSTGSSGSNPVSAAAIVSNTLSNMLSQISNDFNIGINYVPGDRVSDEQLELALSTQLFDDRLIVDGNIDVSGSNANAQKTSSIVGDFNLEYKLTRDGRFRVKAFNRSNDLSLFNDYSPYTQGVGIFYRKEFNNVRELFIRSKKAQKLEKKSSELDSIPDN